MDRGSWIGDLNSLNDLDFDDQASKFNSLISLTKHSLFRLRAECPSHCGAGIAVGYLRFASVLPAALKFGGIELAGYRGYFEVEH